MSLPYLLRLSERLGVGLGRMSSQRRARHREFILSHQEADGGFRGREGDSDLYYSSFAVRGLVMLDAMDAPICQQVAEYLAAHPWRELQVIDLMNWFATALAIQVT